VRRGRSRQIDRTMVNFQDIVIPREATVQQAIWRGQYPMFALGVMWASNSLVR
jgi:hypothetical protein